MTATRRAAPALIVGLLLALMATGCALTPPSSDTSPDPQPSTSPATSASSSATPEAPSRPVQPVPDVRPAGFLSPPPGQGLQRYLGQRVTWSDCGKGLQCAAVLAPLDYADPDGEAITLAVAKRPASAQPRASSIRAGPAAPVSSTSATSR